MFDQPSAQVASQPMPSQTEREQTEMTMLREKVEECRHQLQKWPPVRKARPSDPMKDREPVRVQIKEPSAELGFTHIHHTITRMDRKAPPTLLDEYGLPQRREIDCMIRSVALDEMRALYSVHFLAPQLSVGQTIVGSSNLRRHVDASYRYLVRHLGIHAG